MKTKSLIILIAASLLAVTGCKKDGPKKMLDPMATLSIRPAKGVKLRSAEASGNLHLTALEIVRQAKNMSYQSTIETQPIPSTWIRTFWPEQKDLSPESPRLKMYGTDVIRTDGTLAAHFIDAEDIVLERETETGLDTIAYIPNIVVRKAAKDIRSAYEKGNYDEVYRLFDTAFTFLPITGAEWKELKSPNLQ